MPLVPLQTLPDSARVWVFASSLPLGPAAERALLDVVDEYLAGWKAHGAPLTVGRDWREHRFLTVAVDISEVAASGCSIDGLFRALQQVGGRLGTSLVGGGRVYYRDAGGAIVSVDRAAFVSLAKAGAITGESAVFDTTVSMLGDWRVRFETAVKRSWHQALLPGPV